MPERGTAGSHGTDEPPWDDLVGDAPVTQRDPGGSTVAGDRPTGWSRVWRDVREVVATVLVALVIAVVVKTFLVQPFFIPSESMESTLLVGDRVLVSKLEPGPGTLERGDVVVFVDPGGWLPPASSRALARGRAR